MSAVRVQGGLYVLLVKMVYISCIRLEKSW